MAEQDFVTFAAGANANALTPAQYAALPAVQTGFQAGQASSSQFNTFARQTSTICAMIAQFMADTLNEDILDNGNVAQLETLFESALVKYANAPGPAALVHGGVDSGGTNALVVAAAPTITALRPYLLLVTYPTTSSANATAQSPATVQTTDSGGQTSVRTSLLRADGSPVQAGDWFAGSPLFMLCDGTNWRLVFAPGQRLYTGRDAGTADAMTVVTTPTFTTLVDGHVLHFIKGATPNTSITPKVSPNGLSGVTITRADGSAVVAGDLPPNQIIPVQYDAPNNVYRLLWPVTPMQVPRLQATIDLYADANNGNDSNLGTQGAPVKSLSRLLSLGTTAYSFVTFNAHLAAGTYTAMGVYPKGTGTINIIGASGDPTQTVITGSSFPNLNALNVITNGATYTFSNLTRENTGTGAHTLAVTSNAQVADTNVLSRTTVSGNQNSYYYSQSSVNINNGCSVQGNMGSLISGEGGGCAVFFNNGSTFVHQTQTTYSTATLVAFSGARIVLGSGFSFTGAPVVNSQRYVLIDYAILNANGAAIPGDGAGTVSNAKFNA